MTTLYRRLRNAQHFSRKSPAPEPFKTAFNNFFFKDFKGLFSVERDSGEGMSQSSIKSLQSQRTGLGMFIRFVEELRNSKLSIKTQDKMTAGLKQAKTNIFFPILFN